MDRDFTKIDSSEYKDDYNRGLTQGYEIGYDVAKKEYLAFYNNYINIKDDFYNFKEELIARFDEKYAIETESFILNVGVLHHFIRPYILDDEITVENIYRTQEDDYEFIHFVRVAAELFLAQDNSTANKDALGKIKAYVKLGLHLTDCDYLINDHYGADFEKMQMEVMEMEWNRN